MQWKFQLSSLCQSLTWLQDICPRPGLFRPSSKSADRQITGWTFFFKAGIHSIIFSSWCHRPRGKMTASIATSCDWLQPRPNRKRKWHLLHRDILLYQTVWHVGHGPGLGLGPNLSSIPESLPRITEYLYFHEQYSYNHQFHSYSTRNKYKLRPPICPTSQLQFGFIYRRSSSAISYFKLNTCTIYEAVKGLFLSPQCHIAILSFVFFFSLFFSLS